MAIENGVMCQWRISKSLASAGYQQAYGWRANAGVAKKWRKRNRIEAAGRNNRVAAWRRHQCRLALQRCENINGGGQYQAESGVSGWHRNQPALAGGGWRQAAAAKAEGNTWRRKCNGWLKAVTVAKAGNKMKKAERRRKLMEICGLAVTISAGWLSNGNNGNEI